MKVINTKIKGLKIIQHNSYGDNRGKLRVTFIKEIINFDNLVFDYATSSKKNTLRGFHFQTKYKQAKYVSVLKGKILDCVIDLRKKSKTFGKSFKIILSEKNCKSLYIPAGFAHAYYSYSNSNIIYYRLSNYYHPEFESGILWNDNFFKIKWPNRKPIISKKDKSWKTFLSYNKNYKWL